MAAILDVDATFGVELWLAAFKVAGQRCLRKNEIQMGKNLQVNSQLLGVRHELTA